MKSCILSRADQATMPMHRPLLLLLCLLALPSRAAQAADESALLAVLRSDVGVPAKCAACRELRVHGTAAAVPALAALLGPDRVGHAARDALEAMPYPEAGAALRNALPGATGESRLGIIDSLGRRGDAAAVPLLAPLTADQDAAMAAAAARALGRIGGRHAEAALFPALDAADTAVRTAAADGLLHCAEGRVAAGDPDGAASLYRRLLDAGVPDAVRAAAWRGSVLAVPVAGSQVLAEALQGNDELLRATAIHLVYDLRDPQCLETAIRRWESLPPAAQVAVLESQIRLGLDPASTLRMAAASPDAAPRMAAWHAVAACGDPSMIPALAHAAATGDAAEQAAARDALERIHGTGVQDAMQTGLATADAGACAELLRALGERGDREAIPALLAHARADAEPMRLAALESLGRLAAPETLAALLELAADTPSEPARAAALRAVVDVCRQGQDPDQAARTVVDGLHRFPPATRASVLPLLAELATPHALAALQATTGDPDPTLAREAVRVLGRWPDAAATPHLQHLAGSAANAATRALALQGAIATAGREPDADLRLALLQTCRPLSTSAAEQKLLLGQLSGVPRIEALEIARAQLADPALVQEAAAAAIRIAEALAEEYPQQAGIAASQVLAASDLPGIADRARNLLAQAAAHTTSIRHWLVAGPYQQAGVVGATNVFPIAFAPESDPDTVAWHAVPIGDVVNLAALFPGRDHAVAYLRAQIISPVDTEALLLLGSDDGIQAWLNGESVLTRNVDRGMVADQDSAPIRLHQGANQLLLKISQGGGGWSACARITNADTLPIAGLHATTLDAPPLPATTPEMPASPSLPPRETYQTLRLSDQFYAEGAAAADFNRDGHPDLVAGPFWFEGPEFQQQHEYRPVTVFDPHDYSDNFLTFTGDFNGDGWPDVLCAPFPGAEAWWYENPAGQSGHWPRRLAHNNVGNESPAWGDVTGDDRPELVFCIDGFLGYAGPNAAAPEQPWTFHPISTQDSRFQRFTHGAGIGDINGDGRNDILEATGWWEQPDAAQPGQPWPFHPHPFAEAAAQMLVHDVDNDGLADVITAWHCHHYGMVWWQQSQQPNGSTSWSQHEILSPTPDLQSPAFRPSQLHALALVDMNNDGLQDILTGKRFWSHGPTGDKEPDAPAILFYFALQRDSQGHATFIPRLIHDDSGVGTQVNTADLNLDGHPDPFVANKKGIFIHLSQPAP